MTGHLFLFKYSDVREMKTKGLWIVYDGLLDRRGKLEVIPVQYIQLCYPFNHCNSRHCKFLNVIWKRSGLLELMLLILLLAVAPLLKWH